MSWGEEQKKEIETIRERKITVKLSDADCDRLARKCGKHGLTIGELIENFVGDLVGGTYSNGSDEWKDIVYHKYNDDFTSYECVPCYNSVDEYIASEKEDLESYKADLEEALEELKDMRADWKPEKEPNMNEEIELIKKWVKEREDFINE